MDKSFAVDETLERIENLPEQQVMNAYAEVASRLYSRYPLVRAFVNLAPWGGSADVLLTSRAQIAFEGQIQADILDLRNLIANNDPARIEDLEARLVLIEERLRSSDHINTADWIDESIDFKRLSSIFVAPFQYDLAFQLLGKNRRLILTGPPHIGKSTTALQLASDIKSTQNLQAIVRLQGDDDWRAWEQVSDLVIILDDSLGGSRFERENWANRWDEITSRLSRKNYVIATTRREVLEQAKAQTKLGEDKVLGSYLVELQQEESYNNAKLLEILEKHLNYAADENGQSQITAEQVAWAKDQKWHIIQRLKFPHNIERFCSVHLPKVSHYGEIDNAIEEARWIEQAVQKWVEGLPPADRWFVFIVALFPRVPASAVDKILRYAADTFDFTPDRVGHLTSRHSAYIADAGRPSLRHVTYQEAIIEILREQYKIEIGQIADQGLMAVLESDVQSFARCLHADYGWPRANKETASDGFLIDPYLEQLARTYAFLRSKIFVGLKPILEPCHCPYSGTFIGIVPDDGRLLHLAVVPGEVDDPLYEIYQSADVKKDLDNLAKNAWDNYVPVRVERLLPDDLAQRSPQIHALQLIKTQVDYIFGRQRLPEPINIRMLRWERVLRRFSDSDLFGKRHLEIDYKAPFGQAEFDSLREQLALLVSGPVPSHWHEEAWENRIHQYSKNFFRLQRLMSAATADGQFYTGPLFPREDRSEAGYYGDYPRLSYSPERFREIVRIGLETILESYRWMVDFCFSPLRDNMLLYRRFPIKVLCGVNYNADRNNFGASHCTVYLLPGDFPTKDDQPMEILVEENTGSYDPQDATQRPFPDSIQERLDVAHQSGWMRNFSWNPYNFCHDSDIITTVYNWLKSDLDNAMEWENIGRERSKKLLENIAAHVDAQNRITGQNVQPAVFNFALTDPWEIADWER